MCVVKGARLASRSVRSFTARSRAGENHITNRSTGVAEPGVLRIQYHWPQPDELGRYVVEVRGLIGARSLLPHSAVDGYSTVCSDAGLSRVVYSAAGLIGRFAFDRFALALNHRHHSDGSWFARCGVQKYHPANESAAGV